MKGIILAGGKATRLYPMTISVSKQLLPVYDKPMIYYPLSTLMLAGIRDILIICNPSDKCLFQNLFGDGSDLGLHIEYTIQEKPNGLAEAFILGEEFIGNDSVCLILGDNIFFGQAFSPILKQASKITEGAQIFGYYVDNPKEYGVVSFDEKGIVTKIEEKPKHPETNYAVPGLYFYDNKVVEYAKNVKPSKRGELEITSINQMYLEDKKLSVKLLGRGFSWMDTGNPDALAEAVNYVEAIQKRQGLYIACLEEIAYSKGWIDKEKLLEFSKKYKKTAYGKYLKKLVGYSHV